MNLNRLYFLLIVLLQALIFVFGGLSASMYGGDKDILGRGIIISGIPASGFSLSEVKESLEKELSLPSRIVFVWKEREFAISIDAGNISFNFDQAINEAFRTKNVFHEIAWFPPTINIAVPFTVADNFLREEIIRIKAAFDHPPEDARLFIRDGIPYLEDEAVGLCLDISRTKQEAIKRLNKGQTIHIPIRADIVEPEITGTSLPDINNLLSKYKTPLNWVHANAINNIRIALDSLNGVIIEPGETLSFNDMVGPITAARGYKNAQIIENHAETITGLSGGLNQLATTMYQASLHAGLEIMERHPHTGSVFYVPLGLGSIVNYRSRDLIIKNIVSHPILLCGCINDTSLEISFYGAPGPESAYAVKIVNEIVETIEPIRFEQEAPGLQTGQTEVVQKPQKGYRVKVYKILFEFEDNDNSEIKRELISEDFYPPVNEIVRIGTKPK